MPSEMESELRFGTGASPALLVDVEGCLRVGGSFSDELGSAIERWLELAALSNEEFVVVVWSSEAESAREGARWLGQRLHRRVVGIEKSGLSLGRVRPSDVVVDDDESWLLLVSALGPTSMTPARFMAMVEAENLAHRRWNVAQFYAAGRLLTASPVSSRPSMKMI